MSLTANGKAITTSATSESPQQSIMIRRARLRDGPQIGRVAATTYYSTPLTAFLAPRREKYYADYERGFIQRAISRMLVPRNMSFVACPVGDEGRVVGIAQFARLGDDHSAKELIREVGQLKRILLWVLSWLYWVYCKILDWVVGGDKSSNKEGVKMFGEWVKEDGERFWGSHQERANRWHAQSVVVLKEWQGKGIGKRLMGEVIKKAERDGVIVGLEASVPGELMYRKLGFELLGRFNDGQDYLGEGQAGGVMMWCPKGWKERVGGEL
jgi:GNAT superfamily N-acetyltransferase